MGTPPRSPLLGYNHNVRYQGRIFHVQTEDSGPTNPHLFTHLYYEGTVLASKRLEYDKNAPEELVRVLMQGQHKAILKELKQATHDERIGSFFAGRHEPMSLPEEVTPPPIAIPAAQPTLDLDALPPLEGTPVVPIEPIPVYQKPAGTGTYALRGNTSDRPFDGAPRGKRPRPVQPAIPGVVVQRNVVVGGANPPPSGAAKPAPRRPGHAPYVVKEGSHPMASPARPAVTTLPPPPHPLDPRATTPGNAPLTSAQRSETPPPVEVISDRSLDEVILAYLSQDPEPR